MFWFAISVLFLVLWLNAQSKAKKSFEEGYRNGYQEFGNRLRKQLKKSEVHDKGLLELAGPDSRTTELTTSNDLYDLEAEEVDSYSEQPNETASETKSNQAVHVHVAASIPRKSSDSLRNLNTILYTASFLLIAAAATFVATAMSPVVRLAGLIAVTIVFYVAGALLYKYVARLRPAAVAFIGTGLAILPFVGIALVTLGGVSGEIAWLLTSIVGLVVYVHASLLLQNQLVSYLTMAFLLSLVSSSVSVASLPIMWDFVGLIGLSLVVNSVRFLRPSWVPEIFQKPVATTGDMVTPIALGASVFINTSMTIEQYELLFGIATAHYFVVWLQVRSLLYETIVRVLVHLTLLIVAWDVSDERVLAFGLWWSSLIVTQSAYSLWRYASKNKLVKMAERGWLIALMIGLFIGMAFWQLTEHAAILTTMSLIIAGILGVVIAKRLQSSYWLYIPVGVLAVLPFVDGRWLLDPHVPWLALVFIFAFFGVVAIKLFDWISRTMSDRVDLRQLALVGVVVYAICALFAGLFAVDMVVLGWSFALIAVILVMLSYSLREPVVEVLGVVGSVAAIILWVMKSSVLSEWRWTVAVLLATGLIGIGTFVHHYFEANSVRRNFLSIAGIITFGLLMFNLTSSTEVIQTSFVLITASMVGLFALRWYKGDKFTHDVKTIVRFGYFAYLLSMIFLSLRLPLDWVSLGFAIIALVMWLASHKERVEPLVIVGNLSLVVSVAAWLSWSGVGVKWYIFDLVWLAGAALYVHYLVMVSLKDRKRQEMSFVSVLLLCIVAILPDAFSLYEELQVAAAATLVAAAITMFVHGLFSKSDELIEASIYTGMVGAQWLVHVVFPDIMPLVYAYWWGATLVTVAWWRQKDATIRLIIAMGIITTVTAFEALSEGGPYQLIFLVEHLILLAIGAVRRVQWAMWWGVAASVAAVLYFIRDYVYLWLSILGLSLIALVVWRLLRPGKMSSR